jgi:universal stress protein E
MASFQNILVGIDLTQCEQLAIESLPAITQNVFHYSVWLARKTGAPLTFLSALNLTAETFNMLAEKHRLALSRTIENNAGGVLAELVRQARQAGVRADSVFVHGKGWLELVRQVLRGGHDLVLLGTRNFTGTRRMLLGNTALKLLRRCPCPVWVTREAPPDRALKVLVASDLKQASAAVLEAAVAVAVAVEADLHVLHAVEYPLYHLWASALPDDVGPAYQRQANLETEKILRGQFEQAARCTSCEQAKIHIVDHVGRSDETILQFVEEHQIDLLIIGTVGRGGIAGVTIGNTAERLLPELTCSVLAVKPPDFVCPVELP